MPPKGCIRFLEAMRRIRQETEEPESPEGNRHPDPLIYIHCDVTVPKFPQVWQPQALPSPGLLWFAGIGRACFIALSYYYYYYYYYYTSQALHFFFFFYKLKVSGNPYIQQVYWHHFSNRICSLGICCVTFQ